MPLANMSRVHELDRLREQYAPLVVNGIRYSSEGNVYLLIARKFIFAIELK